MKKVLYFFGCFAYVMGTIGGIGYCLYCKAWVIAICVAVLAGFGFPTAKKLFNKLLNE